MKVSIITAVYNSRDTIEDSIRSVLDQKYENIEYIVVDGGSSDGTVEIVKKYQERISKFTSEPDKGIYHALNKGLEMATGDIVGFLHADDMYANSLVLDWIVSRIMNCNTDSCYGDLQYVYRKNTSKTLRYWKSCPYSRGLFKKGWMPPHPTFFVRKEVFDKYGHFNTDFKIAADYEHMLRVLEKKKISTYYIPEVLVKMRIGGKSNRGLKNLLMKSSEDYRAWKVNNLEGGLFTILLKNISKLPQFFCNK
ncbi:MAG: glycosyltransferase family 2 protein [Nitrospirota bacterium]